MSIFEALMLLCFGFAWPVSIYKSYTSRTAKGKSFSFMVIVLCGYIAGITHKIIYSRDLVMILYILNFLMVFTDLLLYYRNKKIDRQTGVL